MNDPPPPYQSAEGVTDLHVLTHDLQGIAHHLSEQMEQLTTVVDINARATNSSFEWFDQEMRRLDERVGQLSILLLRPSQRCPRNAHEQRDGSHKGIASIFEQAAVRGGDN